MRLQTAGIDAMGAAVNNSREERIDSTAKRLKFRKGNLVPRNPGNRNLIKAGAPKRILKKMK